MTRPQMWLDSKLGKTRSAPIDPVSGEVDWPRLNKMEEFRFLYAYDSDDGEPREEYRTARETLREGCEFRDIPLIIEHKFFFGANAGARAYKTEPDGGGVAIIGAPLPPALVPIDPPVTHGCHPETWAAMPAEFRAQYDVKTEEDLSREMEAAMAGARDRRAAT